MLLEQLQKKCSLFTWVAICKNTFGAAGWLWPLPRASLPEDEAKTDSSRANDWGLVHNDTATKQIQLSLAFFSEMNQIVLFSPLTQIYSGKNYDCYLQLAELSFLSDSLNISWRFYFHSLCWLVGTLCYPFPTAPRQSACLVCWLSLSSLGEPS